MKIFYYLMVLGTSIISYIFAQTKQLNSMNKMNFHDFYDYIWEDEMIEITVSTAYLDKNDEFIKNLTLDYFRFYEMSEFPPKYFKKIIEMTFNNLFI